VSARDFTSRPHSEAVSFLDALGRQADDRAVPALEAIWRSRGLFRGRPLALRLQALIALGLIGSQVAQQSLSLAATSAEAPISEQARRALSELKRARWIS
jgi:hypothetical protein